MNSRAEKPNVPTPDAASVYQHHLSQMSRPMRVAVERYVAELEAKHAARAKLLEEALPIVESAGYLADTCDARLECVPPSMRGQRWAGFEIEDGSDEPGRESVCHGCYDGRPCDPLDALLAGMQAARDTPSPAAGAVALPDGLAALLRAAVMRLDFARGFEENSRRLNSELFEVAWTLHDLLGDHEDDAAASTAPAVVRGDGAIDWDAVHKAACDGVPFDCEPGYFERDVTRAVVQALREYHYHLDARLAQLEAAAGKKAGA